MKIIYFVVGLQILIGCTGKTSSVSKTNDSTETEIPIEQLFLPDTAYVSVGKLQYVVEEEDSMVNPMKDLDDRYEGANGIFAFRKNLRRDANFGGRVKGVPRDVEIAWEFTTAYDTTHTRFGTWGGGSGWTGQPLYAKWSAEQVARFKQSSPGLTPDFGPEEIMVGSLCGKGYFINYQTGKASREPLDLGNVVKGTMSLDPEYMNLYVGQGVPKQAGPFGCQVFDLLKHERTFFFGPDPKAWRGWNAFDSNAIVAGGYLFWCGENGAVYKYERSQGTLRRISVMRYRVNGMAPGIESSICIYRNYGYFSDNRGNVVCINLNTMRPVWHYDNHDDSDGTMVCREEGGVPYLYTACEVDKQGESGISHFVKLNGLNGQLIWETKIPCRRINLPGKTLDGGMYASPLIGRGDSQDLIFANLCRNGAGHSAGELIAFNTKDGQIRYKVPYGQFAWSSPIPFYNEKNELFIFAGDASGIIRIIRGRTGEVVCKKVVGYNFESSPIAIGNTAVVGCRGNKIYKFVIK
ncbi:MAG: PQQ-like beta-propeller repeat protein [Prevotella sp.]|nr:PQQ-like beta-propeller repeat protein [Prevotella sp.]